MDNSNKKEFATVFYALGEYYDKSVSKELLQMYFSDLDHLTIQQVKAGAKAHRLDPKHGSFFPKAADIIRHLQESQLSSSEKAEIAWAQIQHCLRTNGVYGSLDIDDKQAVAALKAFTTWRNFCAMDVKQQTWAKKEFISMYATYEKTPVEMLPSSLPGLEDLHNHKQKHKETGVLSLAEVMQKISNKK